MTGSGTATLSSFTAINGGTIDVESGTLSIPSTNCTWTGGATSKPPAARRCNWRRRRQRDHLTGHVHRLGCGAR